MSQVQKISDYKEMLRRYLEHSPFPKVFGLEPATYEDCFKKAGGDWQKFADSLDFNFGGRELGQSGTADTEHQTRSGGCGGNAAKSGCGDASRSQFNQPGCGGCCSQISGNTASGSGYTWRRATFGGNGTGSFWEVIDRQRSTNQLVADAARSGVWLMLGDPQAYRLNNCSNLERVELGLVLLSFDHVISTEDAMIVALTEFANARTEPAGLAELLAFAQRGGSVSRQFGQVLAPGSMARSGNKGHLVAPLLKHYQSGCYGAYDFPIDASYTYPASINPLFLLEMRQRHII